MEAGELEGEVARVAEEPIEGAALPGDLLVQRHHIHVQRGAEAQLPERRRLRCHPRAATPTLRFVWSVGGRFFFPSPRDFVVRAFLVPPMAEAELLALKKALDGSDAPADALSGALAKLEAMPMTVALIEATQIGVSVGKLRRHADAGIAETSKRIVNSWRGLLKPAAAAPAASPSPASSQSPAPVRESSGALKRSASEANEEGKGKAEPKAEAPKKSKSSSEVKEEGGDGKRAKGDEGGGGELKKSKSDNEAAKKAKPSPAPARTSPSCRRAQAHAECRSQRVSQTQTHAFTHAHKRRPYCASLDGISRSGEGD